MPIFSTSSLTDMPLVRLRELIMSSRWVRPISEIKRWFIRLKLLEWNESAGLYTRRSLIRKRKIYMLVEPERNYKGSRPLPARREDPLHERRNALSLALQTNAFSFPAACSRARLERQPPMSRDTRRGTRAAVRTAGSHSRSRDTRRFSLRNSGSRFFRCRDTECNRD